MTEMRTPLRKARGLGSARDGTMHFWRLRVSSVVLVPLSFFAVGLVLALFGQGYEATRATLGQPAVAILLALFITISLEHMRLGMQEIIADYIHSELLKVVLLMLNTVFSVLVGAASLFALARLAFGG
ncbi:MAG: succinate dehydrogenase, hydrophobic membrane anchor protein [Rhizobiaceae bacterium]